MPRQPRQRSHRPQTEHSRGWVRSALIALRSTKALGNALSVLLLALPLAFGQDAPIPERYVTIHDATDFPGADLQMVPNVTLERCQSACLRNEECAAFTFNQRAGACFLKAAAGDPTSFEGAISGVIKTHDSATLEAARAAAKEMPFLTDDDLRAARTRAAALSARYPAGAYSEDELLEEADAATVQAAVGLTGAATSVNDSARAWLAHALALLELAAADDNRKYTLAHQAVYASINAAVRLPEQGRAQALVVMAQAMRADYRGYDALRALQLANRLAPGIAPDELARLRDAYGFRVLGNDVDSRTAAPRICVAFSEELLPDHDYTPFVQRGAAGLAVEVEGQRLCVSGVEYGESYSFTLRAGLPSSDGDVLPNDVPLDVYIRDRSPSVRFPGSAYVLPAKGPRALPVETVNADHLELKLLRISDRNLAGIIRSGDFLEVMIGWAADRFESQLTEEVWSGEMTLESTLNRGTTSRIPLEAVGELTPGVYVLRASVAGADRYESPPAMQWFLVSNLGVTTLSGTDGVHVVVQRLSDGLPAQGARVLLVARSNRVLGEATTDEQGHVLFPAALALGSGNSAPAVVQVEREGDFSVLSLAGPEFDLSDRGVAGHAAPGPIDAFITSDRGAYRPGETIHVTALARDAQANALTGLPLTVSLLRPDGVEYDRRVLSNDQAGGYVVALPLGASVPRGVWRIELFVDPEEPALTSYNLLVEDFVPERIDVELGLASAGPINVLAPPSLTLQADYLFGAPAAGLAVTGSVGVAPTSSLAGWPGYSFGRFDQRLDTQRVSLRADLTTDAAGHAMAPLPVQRLTLEPRPYEATVVTTVVDGSSRPVERMLSRALKPVAPVVGVRPSFGDDLPENSQAEFDLVIVDPDGELTTGELDWRVDRVQTRYQWYSVDGSWYWEPVTERQRVGEGTATVSGAPAHISVPVEWGRYELRATQAGAGAPARPASASLAFTAGWVAADTARETPDFMAVTLDAANYAPGDVARLRLDPEEPGVALISVLAGRVIDLRLVEVNGETTIDLPVTDEWGAGAYVTASLVHPSDGPAQMPSRGLGLAYAAVDPGERALSVELTASEETRSDRPMTFVIEAAELTTTAFATVAAVDVGVLNITGFEAPDPLDHYFGQQRLGVGIRDLYGRLIDARQGAFGDVRSGGGTEVDVAAGPAPAEDVVALFSGPIELVNGRAEVSFDLPAMDGTLRLMAVVWTEAAVGQAVKDVLVRDPVVVQASLPRFLTPGDESRLRLELTHVTGTPGEVQLEVEGPGLGSAPNTVTLSRGAAVVVEVPLAPTELGDHTYRVTVTTADGEVIVREVRLSVLYTDPETARTARHELAAGESLTLDSAVLAGFRPGTAQATVTAGVGGAIDLPGLLLRLNRFGYGSTERVASHLQALLLAPEESEELELVPVGELDTRVQESVDRILTQQGPDGSFGLWFTGGYDLWLDAYATDVLLRAEAAGADLPAAALRTALDNLRNGVASAGSLRGDAPPYAYAFYVLARAGEAVIGDLRYYADTLAERFDTPLAAAQLGAALALYGDTARADRLFTQAEELALAGVDEDGWRADYGTVLRDQAGVLALAAETGSTIVDLGQLAGKVAAGRPAARLSSQEAAWELRAAVALGGAVAGLELNGAPVTGRLAHRLDGSPTVLHNAGGEAIVLTVTTFGVPNEPPVPGGVGYEIKRSLYTLEGDAAHLDSVRVGDRLAVVLDVRPDLGVPGGRLMVNDALPAGFELDNANLLRSGDISDLDWLGLSGDVAEFTEARTERFLAAVEQREAEPFRLAYIVRVVSPGTFHYPAPMVEDLYRPVNRAVGESGRLTIGQLTIGE